MAVRQVGQAGADVGQRACRFRLGAHRHQHAAHVRVVDDGDRTARTFDGARLDALLRERDGLLVRALGEADALHADAEAGRVHHDEHVFEAAVLFADERADRAAMVAELQHRGRARLDAQLVLDRHAVHVVAFAQRAVVTHHELRHDEQRNPLHARGRVRRTRQHEVDDVLGHVVLTVGDEDLGAENLVGAVALRHGARAHGGEVGTGLRLRQVHRAGPLAGDQGLDEARLLLGGTGRQQRFDGAVRQQADEGERDVRAVEHLDARRGDELGQALAAEFRRVLHALPAGVRETAERFLESLRRRDLAVVPVTRLLVAGMIQWGDDFAAELRVLFQHGLDGVGRRVFAAGQLIDLGQVGQFVHDEQHVLQRGLIGHRSLLVFSIYVYVNRRPQKRREGSRPWGTT